MLYCGIFRCNLPLFSTTRYTNYINILLVNYSIVIKASNIQWYWLVTCIKVKPKVLWIQHSRRIKFNHKMTSMRIGKVFPNYYDCIIIKLMLTVFKVTDMKFLCVILSFTVLLSIVCATRVCFTKGLQSSSPYWICSTEFYCRTNTPLSIQRFYLVFFTYLLLN